MPRANSNLRQTPTKRPLRHRNVRNSDIANRIPQRTNKQRRHLQIPTMLRPLQKIPPVPLVVRIPGIRAPKPICLHRSHDLFEDHAVHTRRLERDSTKLRWRLLRAAEPPAVPRHCGGYAGLANLVGLAFHVDGAQDAVDVLVEPVRGLLERLLEEDLVVVLGIGVAVDGEDVAVDGLEDFFEPELQRVAGSCEPGNSSGLLGIVLKQYRQLVQQIKGGGSLTAAKLHTATAPQSWPIQTAEGRPQWSSSESMLSWIRSSA